MTRRVDILGCPVDAMDRKTALRRVAGAIDRGDRICPSFVNTAKLVRMRRDSELRRDVLSGDLVLADGAGAVLASRLLGRPLPGRVTGIDLMQDVVELSARRGYRPYLLGARPMIVERAAQTLLETYPGLDLAGWRDGYFAPDQEAAVVGAINASNADCLFVALPTPMKERFLARNSDALGVPLIMGVGGTFDVIAGSVARAPGWAQRYGLEWLFRLIQQPRALGPRYIWTNAVFAVWIARALAARVAGGSFRPIPHPVSGQG